ncbi:MAG: hypothetical protein EXS32_00320 [Opitutus sp.]|nr:hypothetical protein [Opitutus sp.]
MKTKLFVPAITLAALLFGSGCATRTTANGGRETTLLGGAVSVSTDSFQPTAPATLDVDTSKLASKGNPTGRKTTLFWGLITLHDY